jgi:hypothetical protein
MSHDPTDPLFQALARRGIIPPLPVETKPHDPVGVALDRMKAVRQEREREEEDKRKAEAEAALAAEPTARIVSQTVALNGAGVLNAAAAGLGGASINGNPGHQSVARLIEAEIQRGRSD